jgi:hypothetical protein
MPVAGGFDQCYNAQAVVATESLLVIERKASPRRTGASLRAARADLVRWTSETWGLPRYLIS